MKGRKGHVDNREHRMDLVYSWRIALNKSLVTDSIEKEMREEFHRKDINLSLDVDEQSDQLTAIRHRWCPMRSLLFLPSVKHHRRSRNEDSATKLVYCSEMCRLPSPRRASNYFFARLSKEQQRCYRPTESHPEYKTRDERTRIPFSYESQTESTNGYTNCQNNIDRPCWPCISLFQERISTLNNHHQHIQSPPTRHTPLTLTNRDRSNKVLIADTLEEREWNIELFLCLQETIRSEIGRHRFCLLPFLIVDIILQCFQCPFTWILPENTVPNTRRRRECIPIRPRVSTSLTSKQSGEQRYENDLRVKGIDQHRSQRPWYSSFASLWEVIPDRFEILTGWTPGCVTT